MRLRRVFLAFAAAFVCSSLAPPARAQETVSPLPPPVTRSLYRSRWFEFLNAHLEDDVKGAAAALADLRKTARTVGVRRLSDFSRTAVHEGRKAESIGKTERAARAYDAAVALDDANYDAVLSRAGFLVRRARYGDAMGLIPDAVAALLATRESRLSLLSSAIVWVAAAIIASLFGLILVLAAKNSARIRHDLGEWSRRLGGSATIPLALICILAPLALGLGPGWVLLWWGVLVFPYALGGERALLVGAFIVAGFLVPVLTAVSRENLVQRSPLWVAAVDLEERREDASAEDGLRQASAVFAEDPDVWFLLGKYADRSGDSERAIASYERAIQANPRDYRPYLNRGNVHFQEGDFLEAIRDYDAAAQRAPKVAEIQYNIAVARGEAYDFDGQTAAMAKARALSPADVPTWTEHPTLARVIAAGYPVSRARRRIEEWNQQAKSRRLPGHAPPPTVAAFLFTPFALGPWIAGAAAVALAGARAKKPLAIECARCGIPVCDSCRRFGDHPLYCTTCVRLHVRKENLGIEAHVVQARQMRARVEARDRLCRVTSILLPGTHRIFTDHTLRGYFALLLFFFCIAVATIGGSFFNPRELPPASAGRLAIFVPAAVAFAVWAVSLVRSWRETHGS